MKTYKKEHEEDAKNSLDSPNKSSNTDTIDDKLKSSLIAVLAIGFITIGGPIGIALGVSLLLFLVKSPLSRLLKEAYKLKKNKKRKYKRKQYEEHKLKRKKLHPQEKLHATKQDSQKMGSRQNDNKVSPTSTLEMDKHNLRKMASRLDSVSKINIIPDDKSKSTSNGLHSKSAAFSKFTKPANSLSKLAQKQRNRPAFSRRNSLPNASKVKPVLK